MLIKDIQTYVVRLPADLGKKDDIDTDGWSIKDIVTMNHVLVRIETEDGLYGWGEAFAFKGDAAIVRVINDLLKPSLIGCDSTDIEGINHRLQFENHLWGRYGLTMFAISAIDIALWDLAGKRAGKPLYELLGGAQNDITAYASLIRYGSGDIASKLSLQAITEGYNNIKLHEVCPDVIGQVRRAIGDDKGLMTDTNCAWTEDEAIAYAKQMKPLNLMSIEEPCFPPEDFETLARVQKEGGTPIAAGECACTVHEFKHMLKAGAVSFAQPSVAKVGGITEMLKVAALAKEYNVPIMPHSPYFGPGYLATLHVLSAVQPDSMLERLYLGDMPYDIYGPAAIPSQGKISPPTTDGLGLDPDMAVIEKFSE